ncbi:MAG: hypothetical protein WC647_03980 [Desulfomonilaceae bacterium]|jgi:hypothetical protein
MSNLDPEWEKNVRDYINNMNEDEFQRFLDRTKFEFYNSIEDPVFDYLDIEDESLDESSAWLLVSAADSTENVPISTRLITFDDAKFYGRVDEIPSVVVCSDVRKLITEDGQIQYKLAA